MSKGSQVSAERHLAVFFDRLFYCPSCTTWRLPQLLRSGRPTSRVNKRYASTLTSSTAINATKPIPAELKPLYESLLDVRKNAPAHINTSRLQLALQGLESSSPTVRLAILGLNIPDTARRIARLLQADALEDEGVWEKQLAEGQDDYSRGLIIRCGHSGNPNIPRPRNSIPVLYVPAQVLERNNIEILISSVQGAIEQDTLQSFSTPSDTFLAPVIGVPTSFDGRQTVVSQPVHKCLLVASGFEELLAASQLLASTKFSSPEDREAISLAVDLSGAKIQGTGSKVFIVDTKSAEQGLAAIRETVAKATEYEHKWIDSGMPALSTWLALSGSAEGATAGKLPQPIHDLVSSVIKAAGSSIEASRIASSISNAEHNLSTASRINLEEAVDSFSRSAHQELQSGLASAWSSRNWRKLAWYKLFWRVDDVGLIVTDLVTNAWLPKTERAAYELSGRLIQVGISPVIELETPTFDDTAFVSEPQVQSPSHPLEPSLEPELLASTPTSAITSLPPSLPITSSPLVITTTPSNIPRIVLPPSPQPLTSLIALTRSSTISNSITSLTTTSQQLLFRTLSITSLTGGLSALTYFSSLSFSFYETGTIFAVGTVFALWKMQGDWLKATRRMEAELLDKGRAVIVDVVERMRRLVERRAATAEDEVEVRSREKAIQAVEKAKAELKNIDTGDVTNGKKIS